MRKSNTAIHTAGVHKTPIIFRATPQWFIGMETQGLRQQALGEIKGVRWIPDWGQARIEKNG